MATREAPWSARSASTGHHLVRVFVGVSPTTTEPRFRAGGLWTGDSETADLGDALIELRAFDTSYWSVAIADPGLGQQLPWVRATAS